MAQEVNTLNVFPNAAGTRVWVMEEKDSGQRTADHAEVLNAVYASGYVPRTKRVTSFSRKEGTGAHVTHTFRITKL